MSGPHHGVRKPGLVAELDHDTGHSGRGQTFQPRHTVPRQRAARDEQQLAGPRGAGHVNPPHGPAEVLHAGEHGRSALLHAFQVEDPLDGGW